MQGLILVVDDEPKIVKLAMVRRRWLWRAMSGRT
jgi:hypothetical protein